MNAKTRPFWLTVEAYFTWALLAAVLLTAISAVEAAHWVSDDVPLPLKQVALIGLAAGFVIAALPLPSWAATSIAISGSLLFTYWQAAQLLKAGDYIHRFVAITLKINQWAYAARTGGISNDGLVFAIALILLIVLLASLTAWILFRYDSVWFAVTPATFFLLISLSWSPPELARYFFIYMFLLFLLVAQVHNGHLMREWRRRRGATLSSPFGYVPLVGTTGLIVLSIAWVTPTGAVFDPASRVWTRVSAPWQQAKNEFNRLFASLNPGAEGTSGSFGQSMAFRSTFKLTNTAVMTVDSPEAHYWRTQVYDQYTGSGWLISEQMPLTPDLQRRWEETIPDYKERELITQTVKVLVPQRGDLLFAAGDPRRALLPSQPRVFRVDPVEIRAFRQDDVPAVRGADFNELAGRIRSYNRYVTNPRDEAPVTNLEPGQILRTETGPLYLEEINYTRGRIAAVTAVRVPQTPPDLLTLRSQEPLARGQEYQIVSSVSRATDAMLREAPSVYPTDITERYLQLPSTVTDRTRALARQLAEGQATQFDKAAAIEAYLRQIPYEEQVPVPPPGQDGVDFFVFESRRGYCDYFASAMVVLARSAGLPARVVSGFQPGEYDIEQGAFVVRELNAHSWVEVFFPEYGWQEFEPSSSRPQRERGTPPPGSYNPTDEEITTQVDEDFGFDEGDYDLTGLVGSNRDTWFDRINNVTLRQAVGNYAVSQALLLIAATLTAGLLAWRLWNVGLRQLAIAPRAYERLCRIGLILRQPKQPAQTPFEYARLLIRRLPVVRREIETITQGYVRSTYGGSKLSEQEQARIERSWRAIRAVILRGGWRA